MRPISRISRRMRFWFTAWPFCGLTRPHWGHGPLNCAGSTSSVGRRRTAYRGTPRRSTASSQGSASSLPAAHIRTTTAGSTAARTAGRRTGPDGRVRSFRASSQAHVEQARARVIRGGSRSDPVRICRIRSPGTPRSVPKRNITMTSNCRSSRR